MNVENLNRLAVACGHRVIAKVAKVTNGLPS